MKAGASSRTPQTARAAHRPFPRLSPARASLGAVTSVDAPLSIDHNRSAMASKKGESSAMCILGLVSVGDASTQAAAQEGGLKTVHFLDYKYFNVLGIYQKTTVMAYGE